MADIRQLFELQELDLKIDALEKALSGTRARLADESAVTAARQKSATLKARQRDTAVKRSAKERDVAELKGRLNKLDERLYGGAIKNVKEMTATQGERDGVQHEIIREEEALLELMLDVEDTQEALREAEEALGKVEAERKAHKVTLAESEKRQSADLSALKSQRETLTEPVPPRWLYTYDTVRKAKGGVAVAKLERGNMCGGCRITLSTSETQKAKAADGLFQCNSCKRILYIA